jgi:hypothetical protein
LVGSNRLIVMNAAGMQAVNVRSPGPQSSGALNNTLKIAYRQTFKSYSRKLDALQQLMASGDADKALLEAALLEVEKARVAHNCARDRLAEELVRPPLPPSSAADEHRVREAAQLLWELAGRPEGTAEADWQKAEQLVHAAASSC